jgi:hypothetical protein
MRLRILLISIFVFFQLGLRVRLFDDPIELSDYVYEQKLGSAVRGPLRHTAEHRLRRISARRKV